MFKKLLIKVNPFLNSYVILISILSIFSVLIYNISKYNSDSNNNQVSNCIVYASLQQPRNINHLYHYSHADMNLYAMLNTGFIQFDNKGKPFPGLCKYIPSIEKGTIKILGDSSMVVSWELRDNLKWSDNHELTTDDVEYSFNIIINNNIPLSSSISYIRHIIKGIKIISKTKFEITYKYPDTRYFHNINNIFPKHVLAKEMKGNFKPFKSFDWFKANVWSGPLVVKSYTYGSHILMTPNKNYFGTKAKYDVLFKIYKNKRSILSGLEKNKIDIYQYASGEYLKYFNKLNKSLPQSKKFKFMAVDSFTTLSLNFNLENKVLKDINIRRAIAHAIDKDSIAKELNDMYGIKYNVFSKSNSWLSSLHRYYTYSYKYNYDLKKSFKILEKSGWLLKNGKLIKNGKQLKLRLATYDNVIKRKALYLLEDVFKKLGIYIEYKFYNIKIGMSDLRKGDFDLYYLSWSFGNNDPAIYKVFWGSKFIPQSSNDISKFNFPRFNLKENNDIITKIYDPKNYADISSLVKKHQSIIARELPIIPLFEKKTVSIISSRLEGWNPTNSLLPDTWNVYDWKINK